tara:strand:+ start:145 stop:669 length:525 start_codon:yes stop_codon:yes gene_type:complete
MKIELNLNESSKAEDSTDDQPERPLVPDGNYVAEIIESQEQISGKGHSYLSLKLSICEGPHEGRWVWDNLNINHPTESVKSLARYILGNIVKAAGLVGIDDTSELHYKPLSIELGHKEKEGQYKAKNVIKKYHPAVTAPAIDNKKALKELDNMPVKQVDVSDQTDTPIRDNIPF